MVVIDGGANSECAAIHALQAGYRRSCIKHLTACSLVLLQFRMSYLRLQSGDLSYAPNPLISDCVPLCSEGLQPYSGVFEVHLGSICTALKIDANPALGNGHLG